MQANEPLFLWVLLLVAWRRWVIRSRDRLLDRGTLPLALSRRFEPDEATDPVLLFRLPLLEVLDVLALFEENRPEAGRDEEGPWFLD